MGKVYWTMRNGRRIDVDDMDIDHLRNTLKMILRSRERPAPAVRVYGEMAMEDADKYVLHNISPELVCECDEVHVCQSCMED